MKLAAILVLSIALGGCRAPCDDHSTYPCSNRCTRISHPARCECQDKTKCCEVSRP